MVCICTIFLLRDFLNFSDRIGALATLASWDTRIQNASIDINHNADIGHLLYYWLALHLPVMAARHHGPLVPQQVHAGDAVAGGGPPPHDDGNH